MPKGFLDRVGESAVSLFERVVDFLGFFYITIKTLLTKPLKVRHVIQQIRHIGLGSLPTIILTGSFSGLALALQSYVGFQRFGAENFIGALVSIAMVREMGPVLTGIMVTGRAGSAMAAELGTMQISEQIDALKTLRIDPYQYLIVPRVVAGAIALPCLAIFSMAFGIGGGYFFCVHMADLNPENYLWGIRKLVEFTDLTGGIIKALCFGLIIAIVGSYYGYSTTGGARGVGKATTKSVVVGSMLVLIANFFLSSFLFNAGTE
jgi:phospholipid/cholesterol/gamma-HCH transport system permease protein